MSYNIKLSRYCHCCFSVQRYHANKCTCSIVSRPRKKNTHPIDREVLAYEPLNDLIMILLTNLILFFKRISFADMILLTAILLFLIVILLKAITFPKLFILRTFSLLLTTLSSSSHYPQLFINLLSCLAATALQRSQYFFALLLVIFIIEPVLWGRSII